MRLFIALNFNENMKNALLKMQNALKQSGVRGYIWSLDYIESILASIL